MSLSGKAIKGTALVAAGTYLNQAVAFVANIILMRMLAPEHFGVLALAMFFLTLGQKLGAFGFNHALIHRTDDIQTAAPVHQFLHLITAGLVVLFAIAAQPVIGGGYSEMTAIAVLVLAASNVVQSLGQTPRVMLEKELEFGPVMTANFLSNLFGNALAIGMALYGYGIEALLVRQVAADQIACIGYFVAYKKLPAFKIDVAMIKWYFRFGAYLWLAGMATLVTLKFDDFLVGTMVSTTELGYYARAYALATLPTMMIANVVAKVAFPLYSKLQQDKGKLSAAFSTAMGGILTLTLPAAVGLALLAPEFVVIVYGEKWLPMVPLIRVLLIYASLRPLFDNTGELFTAVGNPKTAGLILMIQAAAVMVLCPLLTWHWSAKGAALAVGLVMALGVILAYSRLTKYVNIGFAGLFLPPVIAAAMGYSAVWGLGRVFVPDAAIHAFFTKGVVFVTGYVIVLYLLSGKKGISRLKNLISGKSGV